MERKPHSGELDGLQAQKDRSQICYQKGKKRTISQRVMRSQHSPKELYSLTKSLTGTTPTNPMPPGSPKGLASQFSDFFYDKVDKIREDLLQYPPFVPTETQGIPEFSKFLPVSTKDVRDIIFSLAPKSCELDPLLARIFCQIVDYILDFVTAIVNSSLQSGEFIHRWKTAVMHPLIKGENLPTIHKSYRPVSNIPFLSKVLEKSAMKQFQRHCDTHDLIPHYQSAYRQHFSCETALAKIMSDILNNMENNLITPMLFMDLSAAFDTVDYDILHQVLHSKFRVTGSALHWFDSYITPRWCKVAMESEYSDKKLLQCSVPQGSCLGPTLYTVYASTLQDSIPPHIDLHGYADDHAIKSVFDPATPGNEELTLMDLSRTMDQVDKWMKSNRLKLNPDKTDFIMFGSRAQLRKCLTTSVTITGTPVPRSQCIKYLGVLLDEKLSMKDQIVKVMINFLRIKGLRPYLSKSTTQILCQSLVISHLDYCNICLLGTPDTDLRKLQRIQNMCAKLILAAGSRDSTTECLKDLHWLPVKYRIVYKTLCLVFKSLRGLAPQLPRYVFC